MAEILHKPTVVDFFDQAMIRDDLGLQLEEACIGDGPAATGQTVMSSTLRQNYCVIIIAITRKSGEMDF